MVRMTTNAPVPFTKFRDDLKTYMDRCADRGERIVVTRHSRSEVVLLSYEDWLEISETLSVIGDPDLFRQVVGSQRDIDAGRTRPAADVFAELDADDPPVAPGTVA